MTHKLQDIAPSDWDNRHIKFADRLRSTLREFADDGTAVDIGGGADSADLWVTVDGREYFITIRASNKQRKKDMQ